MTAALFPSNFSFAALPSFSAILAAPKGDLQPASQLKRQFNGNKDDKIRVALFVGSDITALIIANKVVQALKDQGFRPAVYFPDHKDPKNPNAQNFWVKELTFYERFLPKNVITPLLDGEALQEGVIYTPDQMRAKYGITVQHVSDVNDPDFLQKEIIEKRTIGGINIRGYQKFLKSTVDIFNAQQLDINGEKRTGFLWNMHPGKLGKKDSEIEYRGIWTPLRVMLNEDQTNYWTLHEIDNSERFDTGSILERDPRVINATEPMINIYTGFSDVGVSLILRHLEKFRDGELHVQSHKREVRGPLHSYPDSEEWNRFLAKGFRLVDPEAYVQFCLNTFTTQKTKEGREIQNKMFHMLSETIVSWYAANSVDYKNAYGPRVHPEINRLIPEDNSQQQSAPLPAA